MQDDNTRATLLVWLILLPLIGAIVLFHDKPVLWTLCIVGGVLILGYCVWKRGLPDNQEQARPARIQETTAPASPASQLQPNAPAGANSGVRHMFLRALGYIWTPLAAFLWFLTIVATFIAMLPIARTTIVPVYGGTINEIFHDFAVPFAFALAISNGLSGRWGPEGLRWLDLSSSRLGFWGMALICLMVFALVSFWSGYHLANWDFWFLVSLLLFGWYDKSVQQGEAYRSSTMRGLTPVIPPSRQASAGGAPNPRRPSGILAPFVALGLTRILVPNELVVIEVDDGGGYDYDLPNMNQARLTALAAEAVSPQAGQHPAPATAAPAVAPAAP